MFTGKILMLSTLCTVFSVVQCRPQADPVPVESIQTEGLPVPLRYAEVIPNPPDATRNFWSDARYKWPKGRIPYTFSSKYSAADKQLIQKAMTEWQASTCVRFVPKGLWDNDYVEMTPDDGTSSYCYSYVGRQGGRQLFKMYGDCMRHAAMIHELGHVIGFNHEQSRPDRDDYVTVHFENINKDYWHAFEKYDYSRVNNLGTPYDYGSVMQYPFFSYAFTYDESKPAISLKDGSVAKIYREAEHLSPTDIKKAQIYYNNCR